MSDLVFVSDVSPYRHRSGAASPAGVHRSLSSASIALSELAGMCGLGYRHLEVGEIDAAQLDRTGVLALFTIGETPWTAGQRSMIEERFDRGSIALLGVHAATDSAYSWPRFGELIGGRFSAHPVTSELALVTLDRSHPAVAHLPERWQIQEELYLFDEVSPDAFVLLGVDPTELDEASRKLVDAEGDHSVVVGERRVLPLAWCIERGRFRSFYTVVGHFLDAYEDTRYLDHLLGGLSWLMEGRQAK